MLTLLWIFCVAMNICLKKDSYFQFIYRKLFFPREAYEAHP